MRRRPPEALGDALQTVLERAGMRGQHRRIQLQRALRAALGEQVLGRVRVLGFKNGRLTLAVAENAWRQELGRMRELIIEKLQGHLGADAVTELLLLDIGAPAGKPAAPPAPPLDAALVTEIADRMRADVADPELREVLARAYLRSRRL